MGFNKLVNNKLLVFCFFLLLVFALKFPILNTPYIRDTITVYIGPAINVRNAGLNPPYLGIHPPVYYELLALSFKIFGESRLAGHIFDLVYLPNGGYNEEYLLKTINFYNLSLIKKFEKNGKIAYL